MTRRMILMVDAFNKANFGGKREVTCYSCHRGDTRPKVTPSLADQYSTPLPDDPDEIEFPPTPIPNALSADQLFDKYIQALGGAARLGIGSFVAHGTYQGFDTSDDQVPVDIYGKAPNQRAMFVHLGFCMRVQETISGSSMAGMPGIPRRARSCRCLYWS